MVDRVDPCPVVENRQGSILLIANPFFTNLGIVCVIENPLVQSVINTQHIK